jgi:hypothetical protein
LFTSDAAALEDLEPSLRYSADGADQSVVVEIEAGHEATDACLFIRSKQGGWFSLQRVIDGASRYAQASPIACTQANVAAWSTEPWSG